ncbi:hypothetical protein BHM03_00002255 [Ensete ventricosum]|nr:hypothetical protein BHM03_00002255 [Ensete ventricosum]
MAIVGGSRSKVLVIGATGRFGQELVKASLAAGHPTYALVREPTFSLADASLLLRSFSASGVTLLKVVLAPFRSVCTLRLNVNLVSISLFGNLVFFEKIPVPVACRLCLLEQDPVFVKESDVATFTICAIDDTRTLNKVLYLRPSGNVYSQNELTEIWEVKTGKKLEKIHVTEEQLLKSIHGLRINPCKLEGTPPCEAARRFEGKILSSKWFRRDLPTLYHIKKGKGFSPGATRFGFADADQETRVGVMMACSRLYQSTPSLLDCIGGTRGVLRSCKEKIYIGVDAMSEDKFGHVVSN